jgi:release factor glutamine methyltransferase
MKIREFSTDALYVEFLGILEEKLDILPDKDEETPQNTLVALWNYVTCQFDSDFLTETPNLDELDANQEQRIRELISERLSGVPLAHLVKRKSFLGIEFLIERGVYIPRKETELLARTAIEIITNKYHKQDINVVDVCTGIGTLAISIAHKNKFANVFGVDISENAISLAKKNVSSLRIEGSVSLYCGDLLEPLRTLNLDKKIDIVVSAPPYISTAKLEDLPQEIKQHEPEAAFDAGTFGLDIFTRIIKDSIYLLKDDGCLLLEVGLGQGKFLMKRLARNMDFKSVEGVCDERGEVRVLVIKR